MATREFSGTLRAPSRAYSRCAQSRRLYPLLAGELIQEGRPEMGCSWQYLQTKQAFTRTRVFSFANHEQNGASTNALWVIMITRPFPNSFLRICFIVLFSRGSRRSLIFKEHTRITLNIKTNLENFYIRHNLKKTRCHNFCALRMRISFPIEFPIIPSWFIGTEIRAFALRSSLVLCKNFVQKNILFSRYNRIVLCPSVNNIF